MKELKISFGRFKNVEYHLRESEGKNKYFLSAVENDVLREAESAMDWDDDEDKEEENFDKLDGVVESIAAEMKTYLKSIGVESKIYDDPIGYGQVIVNLVVAIDEEDLVKLKAS
jgi:hypothetical protein